MNAARAPGVRSSAARERLRRDAVRHAELVLVLRRDERRQRRRRARARRSPTRASCAARRPARRAARARGRARGCPASRRWSGTTSARRRRPRRRAARRARRASAPARGRCRGCPAGCRAASAAQPSAARSAGVGAGAALVAGDVEAGRAAEGVGDDGVEVGRVGCSGERVPAAPSARAVLVGDRHLAARLRAGLELGADEAVEVAVEHALGVADLEVRAVVLDHRVRVQDVGADLRAEVDVLRLAALARDLLLALALLELDQLASAASPSRSRGWPTASARSGTARRCPIGLWVIRTAESVLLTCWPPAPDAR